MLASNTMSSSSDQNPMTSKGAVKSVNSSVVEDKKLPSNHLSYLGHKLLRVPHVNSRRSKCKINSVQIVGNVNNVSRSKKCENAAPAVVSVSQEISGKFCFEM